jgi:Ca-activated chloride channel family protein
MVAALRAALPLTNEASAIRQVIFITDGSVGNERALFDLIRQRLQYSRLFTVGIGSAPNSFFMRKAASFGRGTFTYIGDVAEVEQKMLALLDKLSQPVMADIQLDWPQDSHAEYFPGRIPDLYHGQPLLLMAKTTPGITTITAQGRLRQTPWQTSLSIHGSQRQTGIARVWARAKIAALMDQQHDGVSQQQIRRQVIALALRHHLVSRYTSLVAVDVTPSRPSEQVVRTTAVPGALPHGQQYRTIFAPLAKTATAATLHRLIGIGLLLLAWMIYAIYQLRARVRHA